MTPFAIRTLLDGRAPVPRYVRQTALLAASWHAAARAVAPFEVWLLGDASDRLRSFLRELGVPIVAAQPDPNDAFARTANCISAAFRGDAARVLLLDNDTCFLAAPDALLPVPEDACAGAVAGEERISLAQWQRIERGLGARALPTDLPSLRERYRALRSWRRPAAMQRLYVNAGVLLLPESRVFPALWRREVTRVRELFAGDALASDAVSASCQAGLALAVGHHRRFVLLPPGFNYRPRNFVLGDAPGEQPVVLHMTGDGLAPEGDGIVDHLDAYWTYAAVRPLDALRGQIGADAHRRRRDHLAQCRSQLAHLVREYALDAVVRAPKPAPARAAAGVDRSAPAAGIDRSAPVVIGGLGGSGTRVVAEIAQGLGVSIGSRLNASLDHLWFALLFKRPRWFERGIDPDGAARSLALFERATFCGLAGGLDAAEEAWLGEIARDLREFRGPSRRLGVTEQEIGFLRRSTPSCFAGFSAWGWKEPNSHLFLDSLAARYPGLRYVHVVRHGLDVAFSRNRNQLANWGAGLGIAARDERDAPRAQLEYWVRTTQSIAERVRRGDRVWLVDFDALCADPRESIRALARFLELPCPEARLAALAEIPRRPASADRYRARDLSMFSAGDLEAVRALGFPIAPPRRRLRAASWLRALAPRHARSPRASL